jgi:7-carboxy-7-deazaguanine synthase
MEPQGSTYPVMEQFYTLQGEGNFSGRAAYFIRLAGCDVGCVWCDVKDSWDAGKYPNYSVAQILQEAQNFPATLAVITGGEPAMYDLTELCKALHSAGFMVNIETSGAYELKGEVDWVCVSPKKFKPPLRETVQKADELKVVIFHKSDFEWAESHARNLKEGCLLYLQAEWDRREQINPQIIEYIRNNPKWRLSLQTHKYLNIP